MSLYIVRPKISLVERFPKLAARKLTAESRKAQLQEVSQLWQENLTYQEIHRWIEDAQDWDVTEIPINPIDTPRAKAAGIL